MELLEGNYSHNYKGDSFWGNSIYITVFRNHLSGLRAARPPLNTYKFGAYPYMDLGARTAVDIQAHSDYTNLVGNVLGFQGQTLLSYQQSGYSAVQTAWKYEELGGFSSIRKGEVTMWSIGAQQAGGWTWVPTTYQTQLRQGNWDWVTRSQRWHGIGGAVGSGTPQVIPDSLYLTAKPAACRVVELILRRSRLVERRRRDHGVTGYATAEWRRRSDSDIGKQVK
jgi:hypothetical protein